MRHKVLERPNALHMCCGRGRGASAAAQQAFSTGRARAAPRSAADSHHVLVRPRPDLSLAAPNQRIAAFPGQCHLRAMHDILVYSYEALLFKRLQCLLDSEHRLASGIMKI